MDHYPLPLKRTSRRSFIIIAIIVILVVGAERWRLHCSQRPCTALRSLTRFARLRYYHAKPGRPKWLAQQRDQDSQSNRCWPDAEASVRT